MQEDTAPSPFEHPSRRRGEQRLEAIANSALLKILQFLLTGIALPLAVFGINSVITRMEALEKQFIAQDKANAMSELRLLANEKRMQEGEKQLAELVAASQSLRERVLTLEFQNRLTPQKGQSQ